MNLLTEPDIKIKIGENKMRNIINLTECKNAHSESSAETTHEQRPLQDTLKAQLQDLHALNDSMITTDPNHVPRQTARRLKRERWQI